MLSVILIGIIALLCVQACVEPGTKVKVEVFYETYCPDSKRFVLEQLNSTYAELSDIIELQLVPYGKATRRELPNHWYSFDCQHGDKECYGNLLQSCAIHYYPDPKVHLPFVACMFTANSANTAYERCARAAKFNLTVLEKCNRGQEGNNLQLKFAKWTESVNSKHRLEFVPWIRMNGEDKMDEAFISFKKTLCQVYRDMIKATCDTESQKFQTMDTPEACKGFISQ